jgi:asparagine synthase (glutamine-hydrolysing)
MCGIAGAWLRRKAEETDIDSITQMIESVIHRGPDGVTTLRAGRAVLASARLAIVDVDGGNQPFANESSDVHVVYNGEIHNHGELRERMKKGGHRIISECDGEVIAHGA